MRTSSRPTPRSRRRTSTRTPRSRASAGGSGSRRASASGTTSGPETPTRMALAGLQCAPRVSMRRRRRSGSTSGRAAVGAWPSSSQGCSACIGTSVLSGSSSLCPLSAAAPPPAPPAATPGRNRPLLTGRRAPGQAAKLQPLVERRMASHQRHRPPRQSGHGPLPRQRRGQQARGPRRARLSRRSPSVAVGSGRQLQRRRPQQRSRRLKASRGNSSALPPWRAALGCSRSLPRGSSSNSSRSSSSSSRHCLSPEGAPARGFQAGGRGRQR
mmetsp:Transcript_137753/g.343825  ORF Transcript_137753/g.343825 Transcript_137753/m.343825 type:complete len:270 (+) Transcript_137753:287-1096(+)